MALPFPSIPVNEPFGEHNQNKRFRDDLWDPDDDFGLRRNVPREMPFVEWSPDFHIWHQGNKILRHFRPNYYFTRPVDGKRRGTKGRLMDALTGEGADVFVTISGDKRTKMRDRPQRWAWTGHELSDNEIADRVDFDPDFREDDLSGIQWQASWCAKERRDEKLYNFRNRKFERNSLGWWIRPDRHWMNAQWKQNAKHGDQSPLNVQFANGQWYSRVPWGAGRWPGGRPIIP